MDYHALLKKVEHYAVDCFEIHRWACFPIITGNIRKALRAYAKQLAQHYQLNERDYFIVVASSWFHDLGYTMDRANHEVNGADSAGKFLAGHDVSATDIDSVKG
jgi:hypothetical protein